MPVLIDAYNVLHVTGVLPPERAGIGLAELVGLLRTSRYAKEELVVVCDGTPGDEPRPREAGSVEIVYSGRGRTADDLIIERIERTTAPRRLLVVSSDQEIVRAARRRRSRPVASAEFLQLLLADADAAEHAPREAYRPPPGPLDDRQVQLWRRIFDVDEGAVEAAARALAMSRRRKQDDDGAPEATASPGDETADESPDSPAIFPDHVIEEAKRIEEAERRRPAGE